MAHNISIIFYTRMARKTRDNLAPIYISITINGERFEQTINRSIEPSKWSKTAGKMKGTHPDARAFNGFLDTLKNKAYSIEKRITKGWIISNLPKL